MKKIIKLQNGFSLVELLIVIAIVSMLTVLSVVAVNNAKEKARIATAQSDVNQLAKAIMMLGNDTREWPGHQNANEIGSMANNEFCGADINLNDCGINTLDNEVSGLLTDDSGTSFDNWGGPYMKKVTIDPWGREYFFDTDYRVTVDGEPCGGAGTCVDAVVVGSYGPDGLGKPDGSPGAYGSDDIIKVILK